MLEAGQIRALATVGSLSTEQGVSPLIGESDAFAYVQFRIDQVAPTDATVLLLGETGTGKGVLAQEIHRRSRRRAGRFVGVNCAALPPSLIESELFGHERGAFTDARTTQVGRVELADGGTLFLDEVGELPRSVQAKLLRVLQDRQFERLGSARTIRADFRVIAATNRSLAAEVRRGRFRSDLYYRLSVVPLTVPPLRQRQGDLPLLARHLAERLSRKYERQIETIPAALMEQLETYDWPGNVRELENVLERAVIASTNGTLELVEPLGSTDVDEGPQPTSLALREVERAHVLRVLGLRAWRIEGKNGAAATLRLRPSTLRSRMQKLGITRMNDAPSTPRGAPTPAPQAPAPAPATAWPSVFDDRLRRIAGD